MEEFVITKEVPLTNPRNSLIYRCRDVPFSKLEVNDSIAIPISKMIKGNAHPDKRERKKAIGAFVSYISRQFPDKKFVHRLDGNQKDPIWRVWRIK